MTNQAHRPRNPKQPNAVPIILSAFLFPGAGQFFQKRWVAAALFTSTFLVCFVTFVTLVVRFIILSARIALDGTDYDPEAFHKPIIITALILALILWLAGVIDTALGYARLKSAWSREQLGLPD